MSGVGVDDTHHIRTDLVDLRVDVDLAVLAPSPADLFPIQVADHDVLVGDLVKAMAVRLHIEMCWVARNAHRHMTPSQIPLTRRLQNAASVDERLPSLLSA